MTFPGALGLILAALGLFSLANGVFTLWRSSPRRRRRAVVAEVVPQATFQVLHLDVMADGDSVRVPARRPLTNEEVAIGDQLEVVLDGRRRIAWIGGPPRSLRALGVVSIVLGVLLLIVGAGLLSVGASL